MSIRVLLLLSAAPLFAADEHQLALAIRAQSDFDRVESNLHPELQQTNGCIQSQAMAMAVALRAELSSLYYRKGYCALIGATLTRRPADFLDAAAAFDKSIEAWPDATARNLRNGTPSAVPSGLRILAAVSRLEADPAAAATGPTRQEIDAAVDTAVCPSSVMSSTQCQSLLAVGRQWLGWIALEQNDLYEAVRVFSPAPQSAWALWAAGRQSFHDRNYDQASTQFLGAVNLWTRGRHELTGGLSLLLEPQPDLPRFWMQLGGAQVLAEKPGEAIPALDRAIKADPTLARAVYYRARAEELTGRPEAALADYNLASRTAFANAQDLVSGEAHLYRGIAFYRRKDYVHAENEFASALNFGIPEELKSDAQAWRHMAAVAGGSCGPSRHLLEDSLVYSTPFFPKQEARALALSCPLAGENVSLVEHRKDPAD
jgi:tetratricopeptide (TPR) repeat protein